MKTKLPPHKDSSRQNGSGMGMAAAVLKAQLAVIIAGLVLLLVFCAVAASVNDPDSIIKPLSLCALFLSAFTGGIFAVRLSGDGLLSGLLSGVGTAFLIFCLSLLPFPETDSTAAEAVISFLCIVASSAAGAMIGKPRKKKAPHGRQI